MLGSIKYNLSHLADFTGRDARQTFWYYALFLIVVQIGVSIVTSIPMYAGMFTGAFEAASQGMDENAMTAAMMADMTGYLHTQVWISAVLGVIMIALFTAAFVRRLHDGGFPGWIAIVPVVSQLAAAVVGIVTLDKAMAITQAAMANTDPAETIALQSEIAPYAMIGWIGYLVVIGFGIVKSQGGPNKYGDAPVRF